MNRSAPTRSISAPRHSPTCGHLVALDPCDTTIAADGVWMRPREDPNP